MERSSKRDKKKKSSTRLCDVVIVKQWSKNKCHHRIGISDLLQSSSMGCFNAYPIWRVSHRSEKKACLWTQSSDADKRGSQDALCGTCSISNTRSGVTTIRVPRSTVVN